MDTEGLAIRGWRGEHERPSAHEASGGFGPSAWSPGLGLGSGSLGSQGIPSRSKHLLGWTAGWAGQMHDRGLRHTIQIRRGNCESVFSLLVSAPGLFDTASR
jgi:hypothetical protein